MPREYYHMESRKEPLLAGYPEMMQETWDEVADRQRAQVVNLLTKQTEHLHDIRTAMNTLTGVGLITLIVALVWIWRH